MQKHVYLNGVRLKGDGLNVDYKLDEDGYPRFEFALMGGNKPDVVQIDTFDSGLLVRTEVMVVQDKVTQGAKPVWREHSVTNLLDKGS